MCILESSKLLLYKFHCNYIKKNENKSKLVLKDTDSLMYKILWRFKQTGWRNKGVAIRQFVGLKTKMY